MPEGQEHVTIHYDRDAFAAWPFAHGLWAFPGGELLVGFTLGSCAYERAEDLKHGHVDATARYVTLRSADGGATWPAEGMQVLATRPALEEALRPGSPAGPLDWRSPDFCLTTGFGMPPEGAKDLGYVQYSRDRGRTWEGPFVLPPLGFPHVQVKPDHVVRPDGVVLLFVTVAVADASPHAKHPGRYGSRFVAVYATPDAGRTWRYLSCIRPPAPDARFVERYYAAPVLLPDGRILAALRCQTDGRNGWPELYESEDGGWSWRFVSRIGDWGAPTHLLRLRDGRLLAVYGYRAPRFGIRARVSEDDGRTWGAERVLRDDGGSFDLGYPRAVELPDGRVFAAYYFNRADDPVQCDGGVRHIAGTTFSP